MNAAIDHFDPIAELENAELVRKLRAAGFTEIVDCLIEREEEIYTKRGRLNKSSACRQLGWKSKRFEEELAKMREVLAADLGPDEEPEED